MTRKGFLIALVLMAGTALAPTFAQEKPTRQQIAELENQVQALNKKLDDLKARLAQPVAASDGAVPADWIKALNWRSIGPANMSGRITAFAVFEADPTTYWVASASGGLVKTINNGITFEHQFDHEATVSLGDVCVAPSDRNIVWVGTGEANPRNSVSWGDGVYKSTDGGKHWKNMGLKGSFQIGRIKIHPKDPNTVYVGALGRLYGPNEERGLYRTSDGGQTWQKILSLDDRTGIIDIALSPAEPDTLLVAAWDRMRDEFDDFLGEPPPDGCGRYDPVRKYGMLAGIFKTTDGGKTFRKLTQGLPTCKLGRIALDYARKNPNIVYALVDSEKLGTGLPPLRVTLGVQGTEAAAGYRLTSVDARGPAARAGLKKDDVLTALAGKPVANHAALVDLLRPHKAGDKVKIAYQRGSEKKEAELTLAPPGGGRGPGRMLSLGFAGDEVEGGGILITEMAEEGAAVQAGLHYDDLVTAINGEPITGAMFPIMGRLVRTHRAGDKIAVQVTRGAEKKEFSIPLAPTSFQSFVPKPVPGQTKRPYGDGLRGQRANAQDEQGPDGFQSGGLYRSSDGGETWSRVNSFNPRPMYFSLLRVDPTDDNLVYVGGFELQRSKDGGKTFERAGNNGVHSDLHALWIDPKDGRHMLLGTDGGFYQSYDRTEHWDHLNHVALGQFYHVAVDPRPLYRVYGGLQDNASWAGPARTRRTTGPVNDDWLLLGGGDGFVCRVDPTNPDVVYSESQDGMIQRLDLKTGDRKMVRPKRVAGRPEHRFNWNTPFILSAHNPGIFYSAGECVFRSVERGDGLRIISPVITRTKKGSGTALAESPRNPDVLWVGSDDGALWVTRDGGAKWTDVSGNVPLPGPRWVASIEPSRFADGRVYVAFDGHRSNDEEPYVYVTEDHGQTWKSLRANLPAGSTRVCCEDRENANLLYLGTEFGAWVSTNRGGAWTKLNNNLPTVAVHDFAQHPTSGELVAATHGRSLWIVDVTPLRQITAGALKAKAHLYRPHATVKWQPEAGRGDWFGGSARRFVGQNPPPGACIYYSLGQKAGSARVAIYDYQGKPVAELPARTEPGLHMAVWNLQQGPRRGGRRGGAGAPGRRAGAAPAATTRRQPAAEPEAQEEPPAELPAFLAGRQGRIEPGMYRIVLSVDGTEESQWLQVEADPSAR